MSLSLSLSLLILSLSLPFIYLSLALSYFSLCFTHKAPLCISLFDLFPLFLSHCLTRSLLFLFIYLSFFLCLSLSPVLFFLFFHFQSLNFSFSVILLSPLFSFTNLSQYFHIIFSVSLFFLSLFLPDASGGWGIYNLVMIFLCAHKPLFGALQTHGHYEWVNNTTFNVYIINWFCRKYFHDCPCTGNITVRNGQSVFFQALLSTFILMAFFNMWALPLNHYMSWQYCKLHLGSMEKNRQWKEA